MNITRHKINEAQARRAKEAYSMSDYVEGDATNRYLNLLERFERAVNQMIETNKTRQFPATAEQMESVYFYAEKYSEKLAAAIDRDNSITARCPSVLIAGFSNFPVRKKEKQNAAHAKFWEECGELFTPTDNYYFRKIESILSNNTIYSNDALAVDKLNIKYNELERQHARMKDCNAYYRKHKTLKGYDGISDEQAAILDAKIKEAYRCEPQPYPSYNLTSVRTEMKRIKERIASLEKLKEEASKPTENKYPQIDGVEVVENAEAMRVQLIFADKPDEKTRELLKSNGFRWSPRFGAWQRQLTDNGIYATQRILKALQ